MEILMMILTALWTFLNSPMGITLMIGVAVFIINKVPLWKKYEGYIIQAVRFAEKEIPDNASNKSLARMDEALKYVLQILEGVKGRKAKPKEIAALKNGISIVHAHLDEKPLTPPEVK